MYFQECVPHTCSNCKSVTDFFFSIDLKYKIEEPFLCSEQCYEQYAINKLTDEPQEDDTLDDDTYDPDPKQKNL